MEETGNVLQLSSLRKFNFQVKPSKILKFLYIPLLICFYSPFLTSPTATAIATTSISASNFLSYYGPQCDHIVRQSLSSDTHVTFVFGEDKILYFDIAYFTGGSPILRKRADNGDADSPSISLSFRPKGNTISLTQIPHVLKLQATLRFHFPFHLNMTWNRNLREIRFRPPRFPVKARSLVFELYGFWSMDTGKLCMVGSGSSHPHLGIVSSSNVVLKLNYPVHFSNISGLIIGALESLNDRGDSGYFEPVSILGIPHFGEYKYRLIDRGSNVCVGGSDGENENLHLEWQHPSSCLSQLYKYARYFELDYGRECGSNEGGKCNPLGGDSGTLPKFMTIQGFRCEPGRGIRLLIGFLNTGYHSEPFIYDRVFNPNRTLIGEGVWDDKKDRLCVVACRVSNLKDSLVNASVGDCSIRLSLRFPKTLTITQRSTVVGQISSTVTDSETGYFNKIRFHGSENRITGLPGLNYEYTMLGRVNKACPKQKTMKGRGKTYPNACSTDMRFQMIVRNGKGQLSQGYSSPLFVGDQLFEPFQMNKNHSGLLNISYKMSFTTSSSLKSGGQLLSKKSIEISAEGTYDNESGVLCMIGCSNSILHVTNSTRNESADCMILINIQFSPVNAKSGNNIKGTIKSMRHKLDPLYFQELEISSNSIYTSQAAESIWRMDMEITMVLISNTLACVFVGLQLYHVKKHPDVLPFISFVMLVVLTLGYMIPLLLNFEALFMSNHSRQNNFLESGGWLEVNEVIVRVVTMVAFLLQFRLLQLGWSARQNDHNHRSLWLCEKRVLCLSLPLYIGGALVAWYAHQWKNSHRSPFLHPHHFGYQQHYHWRDLKSYAGLILDGFLLPQIMFNAFLNSKENTLASSFYLGTTVVRLLPHAYDLYRARNSAWSLDLSYIYGNHKHDFYSTAWDIIIPFVGLLFAAFIYLQQRYGGRCVLPRRYRETSDYEKVPVVSSDEVPGDALN
ncbi:hypothetical protein JCGZ_21442 [Jatropha curcas]|uniref:RING-type E3 ubiquitin transferase n=1 Tax=Jatropha curcas TaxID=180498 RepID=A0A067JAY3_JATCU|nr:uncharacterized protein LOC105649541 [Jatropha curcas]KDP20971.1 hypothetical protein JCGZ_21442 [Jatropha curcas]